MKTVVVVLLTCTALAAASCAFAVNLRSGSSVIYTEKRSVNEDILAAGQRVDVASRVKGDVTAAGQSVTVSGPVEDSVLLAGSDVVLSGDVGNDAWMVGSSVILGGGVRDNAYIAGSEVTANSKSKVGADLLAAGNTVTVMGDVGRNLRAAGSSISIGGSVGGNVYARGQDIRILDDAVIRGNLYYESRNRARIAPGAKISGRIVHQLPPRERARPAFFFGFIWWLGWFIASIVFGIAVILLFPTRSQKSADAVRYSFGLSLGVGLAALIGVPIASFIIMITLVGIPLALAVLAVYLVLLFAARVFVGLAIGQWILGRFQRDTESPIGAMVLGIFLLSLVGLVPYLGWLESFIVIIAGLGGLLISWWTGRRASLAEGTAASVPAGPEPPGPPPVGPGE